MERHVRLRDSGLEWRVLQDETIVLDLEGSRYLAITSTRPRRCTTSMRSAHG